MSGNNTAQQPQVIVLVSSGANLLSSPTARVDPCWKDDFAECGGGVAKVDAYRRHHVGYVRSQQPSHNTIIHSLVVPRLDTRSAFVQRHPKQWEVNRLVLKELLGYKLYVSSPSLLHQNQLDTNDKDASVSRQDLSGLQAEDFSLLLTNVAVPPTLSWHPFVKNIFWDPDTRCAGMSVAAAGDPLNVDALAATQASLLYIARINENHGCHEEDLVSNPPKGTCWISVVMFTDSPLHNPMEPFVSALAELEHAPSVILGVDPGTASSPTPTKLLDTFVVTYTMDADHFYALQMGLANGYATQLSSAEWIQHPLEGLPLEAMDDTYHRHMAQLGELANEAIQHDRIVGYTGEMPDPQVGDTDYLCQTGPCEVASLFVDALRTQTHSDVAFITSGGVRKGWDAGPVQTKHLWQALPFSNTICHGTLLGVSLFRLLEYSTKVATFDAQKSSLGSDLLQVSGLRVRYNSDLGEGQSKLLTVEVYNNATQTFEPLDRLGLYTFATDSYVCGQAEPYPALLRSFDMSGEVPAVISETITLQQIVEDFLALHHNTPDTAYTADLENRMVDKGSMMGMDSVMDMMQTETSCAPLTEYWNHDLQSCIACPDTSNVNFVQSQVELESVAGSDLSLPADMILINGATVAVTVSPKSFPSWLEIVGATTHSSSTDADNSDTNDSILLQSGERLWLNYTVSAAGLEPGTATGTVSFEVASDKGCQRSESASFDVLLRVTPEQQMNQLNSLRWAGWVLALVVLLSAAGCGLWVVRHRQHRAVVTMQPAFLVTICVGIAILGSALIPLGFDDEIASDQGCNVACMATPWLLSIGFSLTFSALFSKLWRINKLFSTTRFRRVQVKAKDVLLPVLIIFSLNIVSLLLLSLLDPLQWVREAVNSPHQEWNTYGSCQTGTLGKSLLGVLGGVNGIALVAACWQAYKARNVSDEFSESKSIGVALYSWTQLLIVGAPMTLMLDNDSVEARYFLYVALIFAICLSMLAFIFVPVIRNVLTPQQSRRRLHLSGVFNESALSVAALYGDNNNKRDQHRMSFSPHLNQNCTSSPSGSFVFEKTPKDEYDPADSEEFKVSSVSSKTESLNSELEQTKSTTIKGRRNSELESIEEGGFPDDLIRDDIEMSEQAPPALVAPSSPLARAGHAVVGAHSGTDTMTPPTISSHFQNIEQ